MFSKSIKIAVLIASSVSVAGCSTATTSNTQSFAAKSDYVAHKYAFKRGEIWYGEKMSPSRVGPLYQACLRQGQKVADTGNHQIFLNGNGGLVGAIAVGVGVGIARGIQHKKGANTLTSCLSQYGFTPKKISHQQVADLKALSSLEQKQKLEVLMSGMSDAEFEKSLGPLTVVGGNIKGCKRALGAGDTRVHILQRNKCL